MEAMTDKDIELLPCPFCGEPCEVWCSGSRGLLNVMCKSTVEYKDGMEKTCAMTGQVVPATAWNTRARPAVDVEKLIRQLGAAIPSADGSTFEADPPDAIIDAAIRFIKSLTASGYLKTPAAQKEYYWKCNCCHGGFKSTKENRTDDGTGNGGAKCPYCKADGQYTYRQHQDTAPALNGFVDIVFDKFPDHDGAKFIEVENSEGKSICFGEWVKRPDGYAALRISSPAPVAMEKVRIPVTDENLRYVSRYGGFCRDCADENGTCPVKGLPCDFTESKKAIRRVLEAINYGIEHDFLPDKPEALALLDQQVAPDKSIAPALRKHAEMKASYPTRKDTLAVLLSFVEKTRDGNKPWTNIDDCECQNCAAWKSACDKIIAEIKKMMGRCDG